jgi:hypothetical protein
MIKWKYKPAGNCPVQAEGWFLGHYFYFRARGKWAVIEFAKTEENQKEDTLSAFYILAETEEYMAGWLPKWKCKLLIYKGCLKFIFKKDKHKTI